MKLTDLPRRVFGAALWIAGLQLLLGIPPAVAA